MLTKSAVYRQKRCDCSYPLLLLSLVLLALSGCSDGSSSTSPRFFNMSQFFPLSSGWETDTWTLFIDEDAYDINGVSTKAMVDTGKGRAYFYSNDEAGLRLHALWESVTNLAYFSPPVDLAFALSRVGDETQGSHTLFSATAQEDLVVSSELIAIKDITTPAGTFSNCLKFRIHVYPAGNPPGNYGYETVWLAKDVGFVKAESDPNTYLGLFTKNGENRSLVSYYLTPPAFPAEELAVRNAYNQWTRYWNAEDIVGITDLTHDSYNEICKDKVTALNDWDNFFTNSDDYKLFTSIESVNIVGDDAYVLRECLELYIDQTTGQPTRRWKRSSVRLNRVFGEWKIYGDQLDV